MIMQYSILKQFIGKHVQIFIHGQAHEGILCDNEYRDTLVLKYKENDYRASIYKELYVDAPSVDAIQQYLEQPKTIEPLLDINFDEERRKLHEELDNIQEQLSGCGNIR
jgi:hypothetical protein